MAKKLGKCADCTSYTPNELFSSLGLCAKVEKRGIIYRHPEEGCELFTKIDETITKDITPLKNETEKKKAKTVKKASEKKAPVKKKARVAKKKAAASKTA